MLQAGLTSAVEDGCSSAGFSKVSEFSVGLSSFEAGGVGKAVSVLEVAAVSSSDSKNCAKKRLLSLWLVSLAVRWRLGCSRQ